MRTQSEEMDISKFYSYKAVSVSFEAWELGQ